MLLITTMIAMNYIVNKIQTLDVATFRSLKTPKYTVTQTRRDMGN